MTLHDTSPGGGHSQLLYAFTLGTAQAGIDSDVDGPMAALLTGLYNVLEIWMLVQTTEATTRSTANVTVNNDGTSIYDSVFVRTVNTAVTGIASAAAAFWGFEAHGAAGSTSYPSVYRMTFPGYASTTFWKAGEATEGVIDATIANTEVRAYQLGYRSTSAINRVKVTAGSGSLAVGSSLYIYGR